MQFIHPLFLFALAALAIPVLIHLFNFRRYKKVYFTNLAFLQEIEQETKKQSKLRDLLILLTRLLAMAALVIAFAQPFIPSSEMSRKITGQRAVSVYIDNSFSMESVATDGKLIDMAKIKALEIADAYAPSDLYHLVTNDFEGRHQRFVNQDEFRKLVEEVDVSPSARPAADVIRRQNDMLTAAGDRNFDAYLVSDFQKSTASLTGATPDSAIAWYLVRLEAQKRDNLFIDSVWFASPVHQPGQAVRLNLRVRNGGSETMEKIPVKLTINNMRKALASFTAAPGSTQELTLTYSEDSPGIRYGIVELTDHPVVYDDRFYFTYTVLPSIPVLCINDRENNLYLDALFSGDSAIRYSTSGVRQLDYGTIFSSALVILNSPADISSGLAQELSRYVNQGGHLLIIPPVSGACDSYNTLLDQLGLGSFSGIDTVKQRVTSINTEADLLRDIFERNAAGKVVLPENIDLPLVLRHYRYLPPVTSSTETLLRLRNDKPFLTSATTGKGRVYIAAVPFDDSWSAFPKHTVFVPSLYNMALFSNPGRPLFYVAGTNAPIELPVDSIPLQEIFKLKKSESDFEIIPETRKFGSNILIMPHDQIKEAGFYQVTAGSQTVDGVAFNYDRKESDLSCFSNGELEEQCSRLPVKEIRLLKEKRSSLTGEIRQIRQGTPLWKLFIILALVFLAAEIAIIRLFK